MAHQDPVVVILAHVTIKGGIEIEERAPPELRLQAGQDLQVRVLYRTIEASRGKERYRLRLDSNLGLLKQDPVTVEHHDRPFADEESWGSLQQLYRPRQPGTHTLEFAVRAHYDVQPWSGEGDQQHDEAEHQDTIQIVVE